MLSYIKLHNITEKNENKIQLFYFILLSTYKHFKEARYVYFENLE